MAGYTWWKDPQMITAINDTLGHRTPGNDGTGERVVRHARPGLVDDAEYDQIPDVGTTWNDIVPDPDSRALLRALIECGFQRTGEIDVNRAYMARGREIVAIVVDMNDPLKIRYLAHGTVRVVCSEAADYVREHWEQ
jgi:hypothetical protein